MNRNIDFKNNLRYYRKKNQWTQKQLAEKIEYTEKSISKWEHGRSFPTLEMILKLADLFHITPNDLILEKYCHNYYLGIDGGGTKTAFELVDENGNVVNKLYGKASNPNDIGMIEATEILRNGINEICSGISFSQITMFAGLSGGGLTSDNAAVLSRFFEQFGFFAFDNGSDIENTVALSDCEYGILVIMGTGFVVYAFDGNKRKRVSGWGQLFDEGGSGYTLGRDAISAALSEKDGSGQKTLLTSYLEELVGETVEMHLAKFYQGGKPYIANFAETVFRAARKNDKVACKIIDKNTAFASDKINTGVDKLLKNTENAHDIQDIPVLFSGGITTESDILFPLIENKLKDSRCKLIKLQNEPVEGAVICAKQIFEKKMRENYVEYRKKK